jgi:hypothetical protein
MCNYDASLIDYTLNIANYIKLQNDDIYFATPAWLRQLILLGLIVLIFGKQ